MASQLFAGLGLIGLAVLPNIISPYVGILIGVFFYALGSGLVEVLCSPIVEACPFDHKEKVMSLLHSFYCWGSVGVILLSTIFFSVFGIDKWRILAYLWAMIPLYNIYNFAFLVHQKQFDSGSTKVNTDIIHFVLLTKTAVPHKVVRPFLYAYKLLTLLN